MYPQKPLYIIRNQQQYQPETLNLEVRKLTKIEKQNMHRQFMQESQTLQQFEEEFSQEDDSSEQKNGTNQNLEKNYLRLTSQVDFSQVRPEKVLFRSFHHVVTQFGLKKADYNYFDEQMRSIRQDLTVQHIENDLTVSVYEFNARISIDNRDYFTFEKCISMLESLYDQGIQSKNKCEFYAYIIQSNTIEKKKQNIQRIISKLNWEDFQDDRIVFALEIHSNFIIGNLMRLLLLFKSGNKKMKRMLRYYLPEIRKLYLTQLIQGYLSNVTLSDAIQCLFFDDQQQCRNFLQQNQQQFYLTKDGAIKLC